MTLRGWFLRVAALAGAAVLPIRSTLPAEPRPDAEWNSRITCASEVRDCLLLVFTELRDLTERFPAETHSFVAASDVVEHETGRVMTSAWIGVSRSLPASAGEGVLVPNYMFSGMAMREPPAKGRLSQSEIDALERATLVGVIRSMVAECHRTPACEIYAE